MRPRRAVIEHSQPWLITMVDLLALLLCFFVLTFAMSQVTLQAWRTVTSSLKAQFLGTAWQGAEAPATAPRPVLARPVLAPEYLERLLSEWLADRGLADQARFSRRGEGLALRLVGNGIFRSEQVAPSAEGVAWISGVAELLQGIANRLDIEIGAVVGVRGVPDWAQAMERAAAVSEALRAAGYDRPVGLAAASGRGFASRPTLTFVLRENTVGGGGP